MKLEIQVFLLVFVFLLKTVNAFGTLGHGHDMITLVAMWRASRRRARVVEGKPGRKLL